MSRALISGLVSIVIAGGLASGCHRNHSRFSSDNFDTNQNSSQVREASPQTTPQFQQHFIENPCVNPIVFTRENDLRFRRLNGRNFVVAGYRNSDQTADYNDIRWVFMRGETFTFTGYFPSELYGSTALIQMYSPRQEMLIKEFFPVSSGNNFFVKAVDVSRTLDRVGQGDYTISWAFNSGGMNADFKLAAIQYIRIKE